MVVDPNNPSTLIWVAAKQDANGDLVPVDPRYSVRRGINNGGAGDDSSYSVRRGFNNGGAGEDSMSGLLLLGVGLFIAFAIFKR
jgi:hypothetical protein